MANAGNNHLLYQQGFQTTDNLYFRLQEGLQRARFGDFMATLVLHTTVILEQANLLRELLQDSRTMFNKVMENTQAIKSLENKTTALERQFLEQNLIPPSSHPQAQACTVYPQVGEPPVHIMCGPSRGDQPPLLSLARMTQSQHVDNVYPYQRPAICQPPDYPRHPLISHQQYAFTSNPVFPMQQRPYGVMQPPPRMYPPQPVSLPHHRLSIAESSESSPPAVTTQSTNVTTTITTTTATTVTSNTAVLIPSNRTSAIPHLVLPEGITLIPLSPSKGKKSRESRSEQPSVVIQPVGNVGRSCSRKRATSPPIANQPPVVPSISINELQVDTADEPGPPNKRSIDKGMNLDRLLQKITVLSQNRPVADPILPSIEKSTPGLPVGSRRRKSSMKPRPQYISTFYEEEEDEEEEVEEFPEIAELAFRDAILNENSMSQSDDKQEGNLPVILSIAGAVEMSTNEVLEENQQIVQNAQELPCETQDENSFNEILNDELLIPTSISEINEVELNLDDKIVECIVDDLVSTTEQLLTTSQDDFDLNTEGLVQNEDTTNIEQSNDSLILESVNTQIEMNLLNDNHLQTTPIACSSSFEKVRTSSKKKLKKQNSRVKNHEEKTTENSKESNGFEDVSENLLPLDITENITTDDNTSITKDNPKPTKKTKFSIWSAMAYRSRKKKRKPKIKVENNVNMENEQQQPVKKTKIAVPSSPVWQTHHKHTVRRSKRRLYGHDSSEPKPQKVISPVILVGKIKKSKKQHQSIPTLAAMQSRLDSLQADMTKSTKKKRRVKKNDTLHNIKNKTSDEITKTGDGISITQTILTHSDALTAVSALTQLDCPMVVRAIVEDLVEITHLREQAEAEECGDISSNGENLQMATLTRAIRIWQEHDYSRFPIELLKSTDISPEIEETAINNVVATNGQCNPPPEKAGYSTQNAAESISKSLESSIETRGKSVTKGKPKSCRRLIKKTCSTCSDCQGSLNHNDSKVEDNSSKVVQLDCVDGEHDNIVKPVVNTSGENVDSSDNLKDVIRTKLQKLRGDSSSPSVDREGDYACLLKTFVQRRAVLNENVQITEQNVNIKSIKHRLSFAIAGGIVTNFSDEDEASSLQPQVQCVNIFSIHEIWKYLKSFINDTTRTVLALHQLGSKEIQQFLVLAKLCLLDAHKDENDLYFKKTEETQDLSVEMLEKAIKVLEENNAVAD